MEANREKSGTSSVASRPAAGSVVNFLHDLKALLGFRALKRTIQEFQKDDILNISAGLAYYLILALFPFILALVSLMSLLSTPQFASEVLGYFRQVMPGSVYGLIESFMQSVLKGKNPAPGLFSVGILGTIWSVSGAFSALINALNRAYDVQESRPFWKVKGLAILMTIGLSVLIFVGVLLLILGPQIGHWIASLFGLGSIFNVVWNVMRWPVALLFLVVTVALIYYFAPDVSQPFRWITPGGFVAVVLWVLASVAFSFYVANFGSYNKTYGSIGTVIILLLYLYISSIMVLLGAELNATLVKMKEEISGKQVLETGDQPENL